MKGKKLLIVAAAALLGVTGMSTLAACNKNKQPVVVDVTLTLDKASLDLHVGETGNLVATVTPEGTAVTWESSNEEVATVANGVVTAVAAGQATITAKAGDKTATCEVNVTLVPMVTALNASISDINSEILSYWRDPSEEDEEQPGEAGPDYAKINLTFKTVGEAEHLKELKVTSSNPEIATIVPKGSSYYIFSSGVAGKVGKATITVESVFDPTKKVEFDVNIVDPYVRSADLSSSGLYLIVGDADFAEAELELDVVPFGDDFYEPDVTFASSDPDIATVDDDGVVTAVGAGTAVITATVDGKVATCNVTVMPAGSIKPADGAKSYVYASGDTKTKILGTLEKYAVDNKLTGLTIFGNGGYVVYNDGVKLPVEQYVPGFGMGLLSSGELTADLAGENKAEWKRYLHTYLTEDPHSLNYMDDKGSVVGDLIGYVTSSYFDTFLNATGDGYEWVNGLSTSATERPIALNANPDTGLATKYKIPVKVGADFKYATSSENTKIAEYNNREVQLEDYVTPYKIYYTQAYGLARSAENLTGTSSIKGSQAFYKASANGFNEEAWKNIGIKSYVEEGVSYIEFEFNFACNPFYAMYYLTSGMFAPVPESFIKELGNGDLAEGVKIWGKSNESGSLSPKDTFLSTGPYVLETWDTDQQIVFKRNNNWNDGEHYAIQGVHLNILSAMKTDNEAALKEFNLNKLHSCGIPSTQLRTYVSDKGEILKPNVYQTVGSSNFKLNLNTCSANEWEKLFGVNGLITQTPKSDYWKLKPAMQNKDFVSGLSFAINRKEYAGNLGRTPAFDYFSDVYMSDPESGISYNKTPEHQAAVADLLNGTDGYGYSVEKAKAAFKSAAQTLLAQGAYKSGDTIELEVAWQESSDEDLFHKPLAQYIEGAFNTAMEEANIDLTLKLKFWVGQEWSDVYYNKMMIGQFDIGFGSVSGNSYNPLNFFENLRSDNSGGFTLNWGLDTNSVDGTIVWDNQVWSFDALWRAADQGAYVQAGAESALTFEYDEETLDLEVADGKLVMTIDVEEHSIDDGNIKTRFSGAKVYGYVNQLANANYKEFDFEKPVKMDPQPSDVKKGYVRYTISIALEDYAPLLNATSDLFAQMGYGGIDLYFITTMFGVDGDPTYQNGISTYCIPGYDGE